MLALQGLGEKARWPRKDNKPTPSKDKSKWCAYHEDFGHLTDECIALRREIGYLLSKGHLKELLGRKKSRTQDPEHPPEKSCTTSCGCSSDQFYLWRVRYLWYIVLGS